MRVIVIGAGAVGGWLAGALARGGAEVGLVARGATLDAIRVDGLTLIEKERRETFRLAVSERAADLPRADAIIVAVKTFAFAEAIAAAASALEHGPMLVTAMNGLPWWFLDDVTGPLANQRLEAIDPGGKAAGMLKAVKRVGAVAHVSSRAESPGVIRIAGVDRLILGEPDGKTSAGTAQLARLLVAGGVPAPVTDDIRLEIWAKLWGNMNMNPVSAITRLTAHPILGDARLFELVRGMMTEFAELGAMIGLKLPMTVDERLVITRRLGDFRTSMLNDLEAGRPMEVEGLLGVVTEMADRIGHSVPLSRAVYALARAINR
jgi:2-dehydropantoate 2-reductase